MNKKFIWGYGFEGRVSNVRDSWQQAAGAGIERAQAEGEQEVDYSYNPQSPPLVVYFL